MKRILIALILVAAVLTGCTPAVGTVDTQQQYTATFLDLFDTVTTIIGKAESESAFREIAQAIHDDLMGYHRLFDIYNDYDGINNMKTINDNAGICPVEADNAIIQLLSECKNYYDLTDGKVNVAMGSVLRLWHGARNSGVNDPQNAKLPDMDDLREAANHCDFDCVVIDQDKSTVYITDPALRLDVGAVAKGWATQKAAENAPSGMLISVGGNVCAAGPKLSDGTPWVIGIQDPDNADKNLHTVYLTKACVVTSGDYQRTYMVDGKRYHHIIDPDTLMPSTYWRSVSIVCSDSGLADVLSTALFLMDKDTGEQLAKSCGAEVFWVAADGTEYMTDGFANMLKT